MIRPYTPDDKESVVSIWRAANAASHPFLSTSFLDTVQSVIGALFIEKADTWITEVQGAPVGFVSMLETEVAGLYVLPHHQGQGLGTAMLDSVATEGKLLKVEVFSRNRAGRRFYEGYGFEECGQRFDDMSGHHIIRMEYTPDPARKPDQ